MRVLFLNINFEGENDINFSQKNTKQYNTTLSAAYRLANGKT